MRGPVVVSVGLDEDRYSATPSGRIIPGPESMTLRMLPADVIWLIEADVFGRTADPVKAVIRDRGMGLEIVHPRPFLNGVVPEVAGRRIADSDCVVFWGSHPLLHHIRKHHGWRPGGWCDFESLRCEAYYPRLQPWLLNADCLIGTIDELLGDEERVFAEYAREGKVFIRPTTVEKVFTGQVASREDFAWMLERARYAGCSVLVSKPAPISCEWRLIVHGGAPIAASQYRRWGSLDVRRGCPDVVAAFVGDALAEAGWIAEEPFVVDACETDGELRLRELNGFSCSGWYDCDPAIVVDRATELAVRSVTP